MDPIMQWGEVVGVKWSREASCYVFDCVWGCHGFDYESEAEAHDAFLGHQCTCEIFS